MKPVNTNGHWGVAVVETAEKKHLRSKYITYVSRIKAAPVSTACRNLIPSGLAQLPIRWGGLRHE